MAADYRYLYIFLVLILFRTAYTIVDVPHNSMLSFLSNDSRDRTNIASMRIFFSAAGKFAVTLLSVVMFEENASATPESHFTLAAVILSVAYLVIMSGCFRVLRNVRVDPSADDGGRVDFAPIFRSIRSNAQLMIVFGLTAVTSLTTPVIGLAIVYYGKYGLGNTETGATALAIMSVAQAVSLLFWSRLTNRLNFKRHSAQLANILLAVAMLFALVGMSSETTLYLVGAISGFAIGGIYMLNWSMLPDALEHGEQTSSHRYNMSVFGLYTLTNKGLNGVSQALAGWILAAWGFHANSAMSPQGINAMIGSLLVLPFAGALTCALLSRWHSQPQLRLSG